MDQRSVYSCATCGEEFSTSQQLALHRHENHPQADIPQTPQLQLQEQPGTGEHGEVF